MSELCIHTFGKIFEGVVVYIFIFFNIVLFCRKGTLLAVV